MNPITRVCSQDSLLNLSHETIPGSPSSHIIDLDRSRLSALPCLDQPELPSIEPAMAARLLALFLRPHPVIKKNGIKVCDICFNQFYIDLQERFLSIGFKITALNLVGSGFGMVYDRKRAADTDFLIGLAPINNRQNVSISVAGEMIQTLIQSVIWEEWQRGNSHENIDLGDIFDMVYYSPPDCEGRQNFYVGFGYYDLAFYIDGLASVNRSHMAEKERLCLVLDPDNPAMGTIRFGLRDRLNDYSSESITTIIRLLDQFKTNKVEIKDSKGRFGLFGKLSQYITRGEEFLQDKQTLFEDAIDTLPILNASSRDFDKIIDKLQKRYPWGDLAAAIDFFNSCIILIQTKKQDYIRPLAEAWTRKFSILREICRLFIEKPGLRNPLIEIFQGLIFLNNPSWYGQAWDRNIYGCFDYNRHHFYLLLSPGLPINFMKAWKLVESEGYSLKDLFADWNFDFPSSYNEEGDYIAMLFLAAFDHEPLKLLEGVAGERLFLRHLIQCGFEGFQDRLNHILEHQGIGSKKRVSTKLPNNNLSEKNVLDNLCSCVNQFQDFINLFESAAFNVLSEKLQGKVIKILQPKAFKIFKALNVSADSCRVAGQLKKHVQLPREFHAHLSYDVYIHLKTCHREDLMDGLKRCQSLDQTQADNDLILAAIKAAIKVYPNEAWDLIERWSNCEGVYLLVIELLQKSNKLKNWDRALTIFEKNNYSVSKAECVIGRRCFPDEPNKLISAIDFHIYWKLFLRIKDHISSQTKLDFFCCMLKNIPTECLNVVDEFVQHNDLDFKFIQKRLLGLIYIRRLYQEDGEFIINNPDFFLTNIEKLFDIPFIIMQEAEVVIDFLKAAANFPSNSLLEERTYRFIDRLTRSVYIQYVQVFISCFEWLATRDESLLLTDAIHDLIIVNKNLRLEVIELILPFYREDLMNGLNKKYVSNLICLSTSLRMINITWPADPEIALKILGEMFTKWPILPYQDIDKSVNQGSLAMYISVTCLWVDLLNGMLHHYLNNGTSIKSIPINAAALERYFSAIEVLLQMRLDAINQYEAIVYINRVIGDVYPANRIDSRYVLNVLNGLMDVLLLEMNRRPFNARTCERGLNIITYCLELATRGSKGIFYFDVLTASEASSTRDKLIELLSKLMAQRKYLSNELFINLKLLYFYSYVVVDKVFENKFKDVNKSYSIYRLLNLKEQETWGDLKAEDRESLLSLAKFCTNISQSFVQCLSEVLPFDHDDSVLIKNIIAQVLDVFPYGLTANADKNKSFLDGLIDTFPKQGFDLLTDAHLKNQCMILRKNAIQMHLKELRLYDAISEDKFKEEFNSCYRELKAFFNPPTPSIKSLEESGAATDLRQIILDLSDLTFRSSTLQYTRTMKELLNQPIIIKLFLSPSLPPDQFFQSCRVFGTIGEKFQGEALFLQERLSLLKTRLRGISKNNYDELENLFKAIQYVFKECERAVSAQVKNEMAAILELFADSLKQGCLDLNGLELSKNVFQWISNNESLIPLVGLKNISRQVIDQLSFYYKVKGKEPFECQLEVFKYCHRVIDEEVQSKTYLSLAFIFRKLLPMFLLKCSLSKLHNEQMEAIVTNSQKVIDRLEPRMGCEEAKTKLVATLEKFLAFH